MQKKRKRKEKKGKVIELVDLVAVLQAFIISKAAQLILKAVESKIYLLQIIKMENNSPNR